MPQEQALDEMKTLSLYDKIQVLETLLKNLYTMLRHQVRQIAA